MLSGLGRRPLLLSDSAAGWDLHARLNGDDVYGQVGWTVSVGMPSPDGTGGFRSKLRSIESAAVAGIVYSGLAVWAMSVLSQRPDLGLSDAELTEWFTSTDFVLGLNLAALSSIAFLWFVAVVRRRIGDQEDRFFSTVFIASAILYLAVWLVGISLLAAPAIALNLQPDGRITQGTETLAVGSGAALILVVAPRFQALFVIITSTLILRTGVLPRWLAILGYLVGAVLFVDPIVHEFLGIGLPAWVLVVSVTILMIRNQPAPNAEQTDH